MDKPLTDLVSDLRFPFCNLPLRFLPWTWARPSKKPDISKHLTLPKTLGLLIREGTPGTCPALACLLPAGVALRRQCYSDDVLPDNKRSLSAVFLVIADAPKRKKRCGG